MAERYGDELADALPEVDVVAGFGVPVTAVGHHRRARQHRAGPVGGPVPAARPAEPAPSAGERAVGLREGGRGLRPGLRVLRHPELPRPAAVALHRGDPRRGRPARRAGDRARRPGPGRLRARPGRRASGPSCRSCEAVAERVRRVRLLYLYPSDLTDELIDAVCATGVPYFDLSLQHVSPPLLRRMRRWGDGDRFLAPHRRHPRAASPTPRSARTSSSATPARPRPTTTSCCAFVEEAQLDWCGFFAYSPEDGTYAADLDGQVATVAGRRAARRAAGAAGRHHRGQT